MKAKKIIFLEYVLKLMAGVVLAKYKPKVVGITGSVGKTSAKEAIFAVLAKSHAVRKNEKNYNNEIGIPLTILGVETGGSSLLKWLGIFFKWLGLVFLPTAYPDILILEMGADRPGDIRYLTSFAKPFVSVVTNVSSSHIEFFGSLNNIAKEKGVIVEVLPKNGFAILNADDGLVSKMKSRTKAKVISFGFAEAAEVNAANAVYHYVDGAPEGLSFKLGYAGKNLPIRLGGILAKHQINAALSAVAVGLAFKMNLVDIAGALERFNPPPGRLNIFKGLKSTLLIDDTYNASPTSTLAALDVLREIQASRKIAVLGDMLELGGEEETGHEKVARKVMELDVDLFLAVGRRMQKAAAKIVAAGYPAERLLVFNSPDEVFGKLESLLKVGDLLLVKGSQGMRMEKVVEKMLAHPEVDAKALCRQSADWKKRPFAKP